MFEKSPTGVMVKESSLKEQLNELNINTKLTPKDCCFLWSMILLKYYGIITIPAVGMPGASNTIRFDLSSKDVIELDLNDLYDKINSSFEIFKNFAQDIESSKKLIFNE